MSETDQKKAKIEQFLSALTSSRSDGVLVKLSLGNYKGREAGLKKVLIRQVELKNQLQWQLTYRYQSKDIVKNVSISDGLEMVENWLSQDFRVATLFTTTQDWIYENIHDKRFVLRQTASVHQKTPEKKHDKQKKRLIASKSDFLNGLGITGSNGQVLPSRQDKYKQINQYVNLLKPILDQQDKAQTFRVLDMGAGKGYLTFALYDFMKASGFDVQMIGVEMRPELVESANALAKSTGFEKLKFEHGTIDQFAVDRADMLIALHACDTATDDAILKGIQAGAQIIVVAPCCHKQVRKEMERTKVKNDIDFITRHGIYLEREAEMVTDGLRILAMEYAGYKVKAVEFVSDQHTPKNVMLIAEKSNTGKTFDPEIQNKIESAMSYFGIETQSLIDAVMK